MSFLSKEPKAGDDAGAADVATGARLIPRITIQAFCEHSQTAELVESAVHDRRMSKVALTTHNGEPRRRGRDLQIEPGCRTSSSSRPAGRRPRFPPR